MIQQRTVLTVSFLLVRLRFFFFLQLNDYLELQDYPQLLDVPAGQMCTLKIVPELYDERASRLHVRRLRELLVKPPAHIQPSAVQVRFANACNKICVHPSLHRASALPELTLNCFISVRVCRPATR